MLDAARCGKMNKSELELESNFEYRIEIPHVRRGIL